MFALCRSDGSSIRGIPLLYVNIASCKLPDVFSQEIPCMKVGKHIYEILVGPSPKLMVYRSISSATIDHNRFQVHLHVAEINRDIMYSMY